MPLYLTHPDTRTIALLRNLAEALHCEVREIPEVDPEADARAEAYLAEHEPRRTARKLDTAPDDTALDLARRLAPGLAWVPEDDYEARAPIAEGWARLTRDSSGRGYLTIFPGAGSYRWLDDYQVSPDRLDSARSPLISRCRDYLSRRSLSAVCASCARGVQALLAGLEAAPIPAEIRR